MKILNNKNTLSLQMLYAGYHTAGKEWCYNNVISPFSRMYLIDKGEAAVYMNKKSIIYRPVSCLLFLNSLFICMNAITLCTIIIFVFLTN